MRLRSSSATSLSERSQFKIQLENGPDGLGLGLVDDELLVPGFVAQRNGAARPFALLAGSRNLVPDPLGGQLPLELGKGQEDVEGQPTHGGGRIELLGDRHERYRAGIEGLHQFCKIGQRSGQTIDLVDHDHVDLAGRDIGEQLLEGRAVEIAAGIGGVVIMLGQQPPALRGLALDVGLAGLALGVERIELLIQSVLGRFAGVDGAAQRSD